MAENRKTYGEGCIAAHALDLIGDRWALLVVRELMLGPKRFGALRAGLPGVATNILTRRLEDLERVGIVRRRSLPAPASAPAYELAASGLALARSCENSAAGARPCPATTPGCRSARRR